MKAILEILNMTKPQYEAMVIDHYLIWCNLNGYNDTDVQKLFANTALFNWWYSQYCNIEKDFIEEAEKYTNTADHMTLRKYHTERVIIIKNLYSKPLMNAARNLKPVIYQLN